MHGWAPEDNPFYTAASDTTYFNKSNPSQASSGEEVTNESFRKDFLASEGHSIQSGSGKGSEFWWNYSGPERTAIDQFYASQHRPNPIANQELSASDDMVDFEEWLRTGDEVEPES